MTTQIDSKYVQIAVKEPTRFRWNRLKAALSHHEGVQIENDDLLNRLISLGEGMEVAHRQANRAVEPAVQ